MGTRGGGDLAILPWISDDAGAGGGGGGEKGRRTPGHVKGGQPLHPFTKTMGLHGRRR